MVFGIIVLVLLVISVLTNFTQFFGGMMSMGGMPRARHAGPKLEEVLLEDHNASAKIAVVEVEGIISSQIKQGGCDIVDLIRAQLERAAESDMVKAVILKVNSPGGEVLASDEINRAIEDFQSKHNKPVVASMGSLAASGGYYVSTPCKWIVANELTITGSIGVILHSLNYRGLMDKIGLHSEVYKSGKFKDMLSGSRRPDETTDEERAMLQKLIDDTYKKFKSVVSDGRGRPFKQDGKAGKHLSDGWEEYADGRVLSGKEAFDLGFVDELGNFETAFTRAKKLAGITRANLVQYRQRIDLADLFSLFGESKSESKVIKVDIGMDIPKLQAGQLYFLYLPMSR